MKSTIRLFKAVLITSTAQRQLTKELLEVTVPKGFIFSPEVIYHYPDIDSLINDVEVGITKEALNKSFHKSWKKIKEANIRQLVYEHAIHYMTTYGFEAQGVYDKNSVYIPREKLDIPELKEDIKLVLIKGYTKEEFKIKLLKLLNSGIALKEETIKDVIDVALFVKLTPEEIDGIKNKEVKVILYDYMNVIPENPVEFLRYLVWQATGSTLLIKSQKVVEEMKEANHIKFLGLIDRYETKYSLERLSEIFYRFKPLFLALRSSKRMKGIINQIRRLARKHHKPMPEDFLNTVTSKIKNDQMVDVVELGYELEKANVFRKIRLAYALKFRSNIDVDSILYRIRNGKSYAKEFDYPIQNKIIADNALTRVLISIEKDISKNVKDKKIYIPEYINYALPSTEKQFTGYFPSGTYITVPKDMIFGIHWNDTKDHRIDLDLSLISSDQKYGWNGSYRNADGGILFSGDMTSAPDGATELFYVEKNLENSAILMVNYYNYDKTIDVPFKIIVAQEKAETPLKNNYMIDPNNVLSVANSVMDQRQKVLGLLISSKDECRFYFTETYLGKSISSFNNEFVTNTKKYLVDFYKNTIDFKDILEKSGAVLVKDKEDCDIDLSDLEKDTILNLLQ